MGSKNHKGGSPVATVIVLVIAAGIAFYLYDLSHTTVNRRPSPRTEAINNGKQIHAALLSYAQDHEGKFPSGATTEECFTKLFQAEVIDDEVYFWSEKNAMALWQSNQPPNNDFTLTPGENVWGYVEGLTITSKPGIPILFDSAVSPGVFSTEVWGGRAIIVRLDGSTKAMEIQRTSDTSKQGLVVEKRGDTDINLFTQPYLPEDAKILLPTRP